MLSAQTYLAQDINQLESLFRSDTLHLEAYTYLGWSLSSHSLKSNPETFLKHLSVAGNRNWFKGNTVVFDDMKSPGTTWLISSALLRINIKSYYKLFAELSNQESYYKHHVVLTI